MESLSENGNVGVRNCNKNIATFLTLVQKKLLELKYPSQIARELSEELKDSTINRQKISYWIRRMKENGMVEESSESSKSIKFYRVIKNIAESEAMGNNPSIYTYHPHNFRVKVPIILSKTYVHFPVVKRTGRNTFKEYYKTKFVTFERTSKSLIAMVKWKEVEILQRPNDFDCVQDRMIKFAKSELDRIAKAYDMEIDLSKAEVIQTDQKIKGGIISKMDPKLRFHDTVGKRVYKDSFEFSTVETAKRFFTNMSLKEFSPEIVKQIDLVENQVVVLNDSFLPAVRELSENLKLHIDVENKISSSLDLLNERLKAMKK